MSGGGMRPQRQVSETQRKRTLAAYAELLAEAEAGLAAGFHEHEHHERGLVVWPSLVRRLVAEGRRSVPRC